MSEEEIILVPMTRKSIDYVSGYIVNKNTGINQDTMMNAFVAHLCFCLEGKEGLCKEEILFLTNDVESTFKTLEMLDLKSEWYEKEKELHEKLKRWI